MQEAARVFILFSHQLCPHDTFPFLSQDIVTVTGMDGLRALVIVPVSTTVPPLDVKEV